MPITTDTDRVRLLTGDTDMADPLLVDDEIDYLVEARTVNEQANVYAAAADACEAIAAKFGRDYSITEDGQQFLRAQRVGHYTELAKYLRKRAGGKSIPLSLDGTLPP